MAKNSVLPPAVELQKPRLPPPPGLLRFKKGLNVSRRDVVVAEARHGPEEVAVVRCSSCPGSRTISYRNRDTPALCPKASALRGTTTCTRPSGVGTTAPRRHSGYAAMAREIWPRQSGEERSSRL